MFVRYIKKDDLETYVKYLFDQYNKITFTDQQYKKVLTKKIKDTINFDYRTYVI